jgi:catechol 2,3-dioxygenase-like lactoylglutathione lyase family enzyme
MPSATVNVRYMVDDVDAAVEWYTKHLGFELLSNCGAGVCRRHARVAAAVAQRSDQLGRTGHARWRAPRSWRLESHPSYCR